MLVAILGTLIVPIYARSTPALGAFPFFHWYQLIWVPVVAVLMGICYLISTRGSRRTANSRRSRPSWPASTPGGSTAGLWSSAGSS
ncbi:MAG TPA: DUF3311 domain-containing protein [Streptosporangiaceae bacterium]|nr:DUF3311 domain-containing protein [Streptosporangiaceae bacterium]